jgi:hypothetical protein
VRAGGARVRTIPCGTLRLTTAARKHDAVTAALVAVVSALLFAYLRGLPPWSGADPVSAAVSPSAAPAPGPGISSAAPVPLPGRTTTAPQVPGRPEPRPEVTGERTTAPAPRPSRTTTPAPKLTAVAGPVYRWELGAEYQRITVTREKGIQLGDPGDIQVHPGEAAPTPGDGPHQWLTVTFA